MNFRTELTPIKPKFSITHNDPIMLMGSCFVENIGSKLIEQNFNTTLNPFGIVFNPISICKELDIIIQKKIFFEDDLFYHNEMWNSFYHHSKYSNPNKEFCLQQINLSIENAYKSLTSSNYLFITLGTAWIFEHVKQGIVVSNCHKLPENNFNRRLLEVDEIVRSYETMISTIKKLNTNIKIIFTLSPIRHLKDGLENNSLSKSILRLAIDKLTKSTGALYFPSYELLIDDLRDYRFYAEDLCHPSNQAIDYIWEKFSETFFNDETHTINKTIEQLNKALHHKPFNAKAKSHIDFLLKNRSIIDQLEKRYPLINIERIKNEFEKKIASNT